MVGEAEENKIASQKSLQKVIRSKKLKMRGIVWNICVITKKQ